MINPMALHSSIAGSILDRVPGGHSLFQQLMNSRNGTNIADAARNVTNNPTPETRVRTVAPPTGTQVPFSAILDYIAEGGHGNDRLRQAIELEIEHAAIRHNLDPNLVRAVIRAESNYRHDAVSHAGAMGLMQLMPNTAASLGVEDPFDIRQNIDGGTRYLRQLLDMFDNDLTLALAAYNAGQGNVRRHGGVPPFAETMNYIPRVKQYLERYTLAQYQRAAEDSRFNT